MTFQVALDLMESDARMPQTPHSGGVLNGMIDGSMRTIRGGVAPSIFWGVVTPRGGEVLGDFGPDSDLQTVDRLETNDEWHYVGVLTTRQSPAVVAIRVLR